MSIYSIMQFNAATDKLKQNVQDSQNIQAKKVQTQQAQEELDLNKKLDQAKVSQARNEGLMNDYIGKQLEDHINDSYKAKNDQLDAVSGLQDIAQHKAQQGAQQAQQVATQIHNSDPDVQNHVDTLVGIMGANQGQQQGNGQVSPPMSMSDGSNQGVQPPNLPSIPGIAPVQGGVSPQNVSAQVTPQVSAPQQPVDAGIQLLGAPEPKPQSQGAGIQSPQQQAEVQASTQQAQQSMDLSPIEQAFGMPKGSMWMNPSTMKPEVNPIWKSKIEKQQSAQAAYDINQPFREEQREDKNVKTAESYLVNSLKQKVGAVGLQNNKVDAAIHARTLINQSYDPATGDYNITQVPFGDLSENMGSLLSGQTGSSEGRIAALKQKTAQGDINGVISYFTGKPSNATSQDAIKQLVNIIDRQGEVSEDLRDKAFDKLKGLSTFKRLNDDDFQNLKDQHLGNSFKKFMQDNAPEKQLIQKKTNGAQKDYSSLWS